MPAHGALGNCERENGRSEAHLAVRTAATRSRSVNHARRFHSRSTICHQTKQSSQPSWTLRRTKWSYDTEKSLLTHLAIPFGPAPLSCNSHSPEPSPSDPLWYNHAKYAYYFIFQKAPNKILHLFVSSH